MDLKAYYAKIRSIEASLDGEQVVVVSCRTPDGGIEGRRVEVDRRVAARMIADGRARLASAEEAREFHVAEEKERQEALARVMEPRVQFALDLLEAKRKQQKRA